VFRQTTKYSRKEIFKLLGFDPAPTGGNWFTGYHTHEGQHFIFANVGSAGRTGHDYPNRWESKTRLLWLGKTGSSRDQPQIEAMTKGDQPVLLFYRSDDRDDFTFAGNVVARDVLPTTPVVVYWEIKERT
jgi:hypothetical protein